MPLTSTTPKVITQEQADTFEVVRFLVDNEHGQVIVWYNASLGKVRVKSEATYSVNAATYANEKPLPGETAYTFIKRLAYKMGQDAGAFPAGVVS